MFILDEKALKDRRGDYAIICGHLCKLWQEFSSSETAAAQKACQEWLEKHPEILCFVIKADTITLWCEVEVAFDKPS